MIIWNNHTWFFLILKEHFGWNICSLTHAKKLKIGGHLQFSWPSGLVFVFGTQWLCRHECESPKSVYCLLCFCFRFLKSNLLTPCRLKPAHFARLRCRLSLTHVRYRYAYACTASQQAGAASAPQTENRGKDSESEAKGKKVRGVNSAEVEGCSTLVALLGKRSALLASSARPWNMLEALQRSCRQGSPKRLQTPPPQEHT